MRDEFAREYLTHPLPEADSDGEPSLVPSRRLEDLGAAFALRPTEARVARSFTHALEDATYQETCSEQAQRFALRAHAVTQLHPGDASIAYSAARALLHALVLERDRGSCEVYLNRIEALYWRCPNPHLASLFGRSVSEMLKWTRSDSSRRELVDRLEDMLSRSDDSITLAVSAANALLVAARNAPYEAELRSIRKTLRALSQRHPDSIRLLVVEGDVALLQRKRRRSESRGSNECRW